ncbi:proline-rich protein 2-like isoform X2 [Diachasmimorpha longicaudata]|uniref:proline-rich protein 2-like isoform X2 n=1 Tax=Diachasmimorpha longicaudata TaxID=58733 RepID=UPI0030B88E24
MRLLQCILALVVLSCAVGLSFAAPRSSKSKRAPEPLQSVPAVEEDKSDIKDATRAKKQTTTFCVEIKAGKPVKTECDETQIGKKVSYIPVPIIQQYPAVQVNPQAPSQPTPPAPGPAPAPQPDHQPAQPGAPQIHIGVGGGFTPGAPSGGPGNPGSPDTPGSPCPPCPPCYCPPGAGVQPLVTMYSSGLGEQPGVYNVAMDPRMIMIPGVNQRSAGMLIVPGTDQRNIGTPLIPGVEQRTTDIVMMPGGDQRNPEVMFIPGMEQSNGNPLTVPGVDQRSSGAPVPMDHISISVGAAPSPMGLQMRTAQGPDALADASRQDQQQFYYSGNQPQFFRYALPGSSARFAIPSDLQNTGSWGAVPRLAEPRCFDHTTHPPLLALHPASGQVQTLRSEGRAKQWTLRSADQAGDSSETKPDGPPPPAQEGGPSVPQEGKSGMTPSEIMNQMRANSPANRNTREENADANVQMRFIGPGGQSYLLGAPSGDVGEKREDFNKRNVEVTENNIE